MITLKRNASWYRPYYGIVNNKEYKVDKLRIYQDGKILVDTGSWFENERCMDIDSVELPIDKIILRRKEKFDGEVFAMTHKESYGNETVIDVYIPAEMLNIHFTKYRIMYRCLKAIYEGDQGIYIHSFVKDLDAHAREIEREYEEIYKQVDRFKMTNFDKSKEQLFESLDKMKSLAAEYYAENERVNNLTVEEAVREVLHSD